MPWSQIMPRDQRVQFIADYLRDTLSITELCDLYNVSRKTGYTCVQCYLQPGTIGLEELSRKLRVSPNQPPEAAVAAILAARRYHPSWGAKKLLKILTKKHPRWQWPHRGTRLRDSQPSRLGSREATTPAHRPSRQAHHSDPGSQRCLER